MIRVFAAALILTGCTADPPAPVPVPEPATQSKVHCDLIFPAPAPDQLAP